VEFGGKVRRRLGDMLAKRTQSTLRPSKPREKLDLRRGPNLQTKMFIDVIVALKNCSLFADITEYCPFAASFQMIHLQCIH
jgi:hypothetical protein